MTDAPRKRRWPKILAILALLALLAAWWIDRQLEPARLANTVLSALGDAQGLEISFTGTPDYALRPEPRLRIPRLVARQPGAAAPLLTAGEVEVSLPWSTLWGDGPVVITRIAMQAPALDLAALEEWQASRPPAGGFELPTLTSGLRVREGRVQGAGWSLRQLSIALPALVPGEPAEADLSGEFRREGLVIVFAGPLAIDRAGLDSPVRFLGAGRVRNASLDAPWQGRFEGTMSLSGETKSLELPVLAFDGEPPLPAFEGKGTLAYGAVLSLRLAGTLPRWPEAWPALPEPLAGHPAPIALDLAYEGASDFSTPLQVEARREGARLQARVPVPGLLAWLDDDGGEALPPLTGTLEAPRLVVEGVELEGVRLTIEDEPAATEGEEP